MIVRWDIGEPVSPAPCQWSTPAEITTVSPSVIVWSPSASPTWPIPATTWSTWSLVWRCSFVRAPAAKLTTEAVMGPDVLSQEQAWGAYRQLLANARVDFHPEPGDDRFEGVFESLSATGAASPKRWADAYLAAFASTAGLRLVTFDVALSSLAGVAVGLD